MVIRVAGVKPGCGWCRGAMLTASCNMTSWVSVYGLENLLTDTTWREFSASDQHYPDKGKCRSGKSALDSQTRSNSAPSKIVVYSIHLRQFLDTFTRGETKISKGRRYYIERLWDSTFRNNVLFTKVRRQITSMGSTLNFSTAGFPFSSYLRTHRRCKYLTVSVLE